ncbi:unnamed protein product, partial [Symbiodinium sp. CCMP2592]
AKAKGKAKQAAKEATEQEGDPAKNAAGRPIRKRKDVPEDEKLKRQSYEIPSYSYSQWSIYWTKNAVGLKLKNVETDCGKQVVYLANPNVSMKDHLDFAATCANIIEQAKGKLDEDTKASLHACKMQFREAGKQQC